ncbi:FAD-dependent oxidoreductase [Desulfosediminicola flagellatus]|uniref:FAD-dependent oxidoreductase n=1 Tax=Desulfosediminicola flagellatus TaxID=2569541 RepID=UPI0010AD373C|nr:FAD-dependent oxidoreductase [Desulfosediminicola flagellatus]
MSKRVVIVGAVALGPKVACRLRRLDPEAVITVLDRDNLISYGGCGIPYYVGGDINDLEDLYSTTSKAVRDRDFFAECKGVNIRTEMEAVSIDRENCRLKVRDLKNDEEGFISYDTLVLATGASPVRIPIPGADLPRVVTVSDLHQAENVKNLMKLGKVGKAVVIGAGAIGVEISEALTDLWGVETTLVEQAPTILPLVLDSTMSVMVQRQLEKNGVDVRLNERVVRIDQESDEGQHVVQLTHDAISCDLVVMAAGVRPNAELAAEAGLSIGSKGGILVDKRLRTSDPRIYSGGDCVEITNLVSGDKTPMQLGSLANRQGRIIASNICGRSSHFKGTVGTFCMKVFELGVSTAGLTTEKARAAGYDPVHCIVAQPDHAHFYPNSELIYMSLIADKKSRKVLGVQALGKNGDGIKARVDTVAVLLEHGVDVDDICTLETGYAPPFASAMDVVNNAGNALDNVLCGSNRPIDTCEFLESFAQGETQILDIRGPVESAAGVEKYGARWQHIPQSELRSRLSELPADTVISILCDTGPRAYETQVVLDAAGVRNTRLIQGGYAMIKIIDPDFV